MKKRLQITGMLILVIACIWYGGCGRKDQSGLETLELQEKQNGRETEVVVQDDSHLSGNFGDTENTGDNKKNENNDLEATGSAGTGPAGEKSTEQIFVYVCGAVKTPGVYELHTGARLYEAIACAGGVREDAAEESINQAQTVSDGERLYIPTDEEVRQGLDAYLRSGTAVGSAEGMVAEGTAEAVGSVGTGGRNAEGKININTASREELKTLNGIGDTRAGSILAYRESNGPFGSTEDLMRVEGIKEGVYNKLKDDITVN